MSEQCGFTWVNARGLRVRCQHASSDHPVRHEWWPSRRIRVRHPNQASWVAVGSEHVRDGAWVL